MERARAALPPARARWHTARQDLKRAEYAVEAGPREHPEYDWESAETALARPRAALLEARAELTRALIRFERARLDYQMAAAAAARLRGRRPGRPGSPRTRGGPRWG